MNAIESRLLRRLRRTALGGLALALLALVLWAAAGAAPALAQAADRLDVLPVYPDGKPAAPQGSQQLTNQMYYDDLEVEPGQVIEGDAVVSSGDVRVRPGGRITGNLVVYSGDVNIEPGGAVDGDVTAFRGDVTIGGAVQGKVAAWNGNVELQESSSVGSDVSVLNGDIRRSEGATVRGSVLRGPSLQFFGAPNMPNTPPFDVSPPSAPPAPRGPAAGIVRFFGSLFGSLATALLGLLVAVALAAVAPHLLRRTADGMRQEPALTFVTGLIANLVLAALAGLLVVLVITACLAPIPLLALVVVNAVGWAGVSLFVGEWLSRRAGLRQSSMLAVVALGAIVLMGGLALLWAFRHIWIVGFCFGFISFVGALLAGSFGVGGLVMPWLRKQTGGGEGPLGPSSPGPGAPSAPAGPAPAASTPAAAPTGAPGEAAAPASTAFAPPPFVSTASAEEAETALPVPPEQRGVQVDVPTALDSASEETPDVSHVLMVDVGSEPGEPPQILTLDTASLTEDNLKAINGIGAVFEQRLKAAGVSTFAALAALPPERIAEIIGWPVERVVRTRIIEQAALFARSSPAAG